MHCCPSGLAGPLTALYTHVTAVLIALSCLLLQEVKRLTIMYFTLPLLSLPPFLSSLFSRAFLYDHKNRKCQWLSFDRNSPGAQSQQDFNYQLYQKKGALYCSIFSLHQLILKWRLPLSPYLSIRKTSNQQYCFSWLLFVWKYVGELNNSINTYFDSDFSFVMIISLKRRARKGKDCCRVYCVAAHYSSFSVIKQCLCKRWKPPPHSTVTDHNSEHTSCVAYLTGSKCFAED